MKRLSLFALVLVLLSAGRAFACPTPWTGPTHSGGFAWYEYSQDQSCYTTSGNVSPSTISCFQNASWQFGPGMSDTASTSFTLNTSDPILNPNHWTIDLRIDAISPGASAWDKIQVQVGVRHPDLSTTTYRIFTWNGTQPSVSSCSIQSATFTANMGDTITVTISAMNESGSNPTLIASVPRIFSNSP